MYNSEITRIVETESEN